MVDVSKDREMMAEIEEMTQALAGGGEGEGEEGADETASEAAELEPEAEVEEVAAEEVEETPDPTALLLAKLEAMEARIAALGQTKVEPAQVKREEPVKEAPIEEVDFLEGATIETIAENEGAFNKLLNKIYQRARLDGRKEALAAQERTLKAIPEVVKTSVEQQTTLSKKAAMFYVANKDLAQFKGAVASVAQEVSGQHPDWSVDQVFEETERETRRRLGLKKTAEQKAIGKPRGFAKGSNSREAGKATLSDMEREILEMNKALGG